MGNPYHRSAKLQKPSCGPFFSLSLPKNPLNGCVYIEGACKFDGLPSLSQWFDDRKTMHFDLEKHQSFILLVNAGYACDDIPFHPRFAPLPVSLVFAETTIFNFVLGVVPIHIRYPSLSIPSKYPISPQPQKPIKNPHLNIPFPYEIHWNPDKNHIMTSSPHLRWHHLCQIAKLRVRVCTCFSATKA